MIDDIDCSANSDGASTTTTFENSPLIFRIRVVIHESVGSGGVKESAVQTDKTSGRIEMQG